MEHEASFVGRHGNAVHKRRSLSPGQLCYLLSVPYAPSRISLWPIQAKGNGAQTHLGTVPDPKCRIQSQRLDTHNRISARLSSGRMGRVGQRMG